MGIAREEIPRDGDRRTFTALMSDADGHPVYATLLTLSSRWLLR